MSGWLSGVQLAPWAPVAASYLFGAATGFLIWGGRHLWPKSAEARNAEGMRDAESGAGDGSANGDAPDSMRLGALESELRRARELLDETDADNSDNVERLNDLDTALKRANGRLKLILNAVKKARPDR